MQPTTDSPTAPVSERVIAAVAAATDTDPLELEPLFDSVDPDALDALFANEGGTTARTEGQLTFPTNGCRVTVDADGTVAAEPLYQYHGAFDASSLEGETAPAESPD